jgi:hypothetical protein
MVQVLLCHETISLTFIILSWQLRSASIRRLSCVCPNLLLGSVSRLSNLFCTQVVKTPISCPHCLDSVSSCLISFRSKSCKLPFSRTHYLGSVSSCPIYSSSCSVVITNSPVPREKQPSCYTHYPITHSPNLLSLCYRRGSNVVWGQLRWLQAITVT